MTASGTSIATGAAPPAPPRLLGRQTASSLLRNIVHVMRSHFWVLQGCGVLPVVPILILHETLAAVDHPMLYGTFLVYMVALFLSSGALTVAVSDICLGNRPGVRRSFARVLSHRRWWHVLSTSLLLMLGIVFGLLLLLPGLWLAARGLFTSIIVVLEARQNTGAICRSMQLTKGQAWRVSGLALLPIVLVYIAIILLAIVTMLVAWIVIGGAEPPGPEELGVPFLAVLDSIVFAFAAPVIGIAMVLLYYDQRVRREAYDAQALSEDLMR